MNICSLLFVFLQKQLLVMPRRKQKRHIEQPPMVDGFKPFGIPMKNMEPSILLYEEYEAIRLTDYEGLTHEQSAEAMRVSRPTFTRIYEQARQAIAKAFVEGKAIVIEGGNYYTENHWYKCTHCNKLNISQHEQNACTYCKENSLRVLNEKQ